MKRFILIILSLCVLAFGFSYAFNHWVQKDTTGDASTLAADGQFVDLGDVIYHVNITGLGGRTIILLHDWGDSSVTWTKTAELLGKKNTVVAVDLEGFGYSEKSSRVNYRLEARSEHLARLLDALKFSRVTLVGCGFGGTVAMAFAKDYPQRVDSLVLIAPDILLNRFKLPAFLYHIPEVSKASMKLSYSEKRQESNLEKNLYDQNHATTQRLKAYTTPYTVKGTEDALLSMYTQRDTKVYKHTDIGSIPILLLWGEKDAIVPRSNMERLRADMVDVTLQSIPDAGHYVQEDAPETVASSVLGFIK